MSLNEILSSSYTFIALFLILLSLLALLWKK